MLPPPAISNSSGRGLGLPPVLVGCVESACSVIVNLLAQEDSTAEHKASLELLWKIAARLPNDCAAANDLRHVTAERLMAYFAASVREKERVRKWRKPQAPVRPVVGCGRDAAEETVDEETAPTTGMVSLLS